MAPHLKLITLATIVASCAGGCLSSYNTDGVELNTQNDDEADAPSSPEDEGDDDAQEDVLPDAPDEEVNPDCVEDQACTPHPDTLGVCSEGECVPTGCETGFLDCNDDLTADGCELNGDDSIEACGACDVQCEGLNADWLCESRQCVIASCADGFADHNQDTSDGCETPVPAAVDFGSPPVPVNHGMRVAWRRTDPEITPRVSVRWSQQIDGTEIIQTRIFDMLDGFGVIGPVLQEGTVRMALQGLGAEVDSGEPIGGPTSDIRDVEFVPQGWFNKGLNDFFMDAKAAAPRRGFVLTFAGGYHSFNSGRFLVPSHMPVDFAATGFDMVLEGPAGGHGVSAGFGNIAYLTDNAGVTWTPTALPGNEDDFNTYRDAAITQDGQALFIVGTRIINPVMGTDEGAIVRSINGGVDWTLVPTLNLRIDQYSTIDLVENGDEGALIFVAGSDNSSRAGIVAVSDDLGESWLQFDVLPGREIHPNDFFDITMIDDRKGFLTSDLGLIVTEDGWESSELVSLPQADQGSGEMVRVRFDRAGLVGIATGFDGFTWTTQDGGETWSFETDLLAENRPDFGYTAVGHVPGSESFITFSNQGNRDLWIQNGPDRRFIELSDPEVEDMVSIVAWDDLNNLRAFTEDGAVLRGFLTPDTLIRTRTIRHENNEPVGLRAASGDENGDFIVIVGDRGLAQFSTDGGDSWLNLQAMLDSGADFTDVAMSLNGSVTIAIGSDPDTLEPTLFEIAGLNFRDSPIPLDTIDPQDGFEGSTLVDVAVSQDGRTVAVLAQNRSNDRLFIGSGPPETRTWERLDLPSQPLKYLTVTIKPDGEIWVGGEAQVLTNVFNGTLAQVEIPAPPNFNGRSSLDIRGIYFPNDGAVGWVTMSDGWIGFTQDRGDTWNLDRSTSQGLDGEAFNDLTAASDNKHVIAVGTRGRAAWTANGGLR